MVFSPLGTPLFLSIYGALSYFLGFWGVFYAIFSFSLAIAIHEAAHAVLARFFDFDFESVVVGAGPIVFILEFWRFDLYFKLLPLGGAVYIENRTHPFGTTWLALQLT